MMRDRNATIERWSYRQAFVNTILFELDRNSCQSLEESLNYKTNSRPDNHTTFRLGGPDGLVITFHDTSVLFGWGIRHMDYKEGEVPPPTQTNNIQ